MSETKRARKQIVMIAVWMILIVFAVVAATLAWFSFNDATNVEPMGSTVSDSGMNLLISNSKNGKFDTSCSLKYNSELDELSPVSTDSLSRFYISTMQDANGISIMYSDDTANIDRKAIHGTVYLKCDGPCDVYLDKNKMKVGGDSQILSAGRLGMRVKTKSGTDTFFFKLDSMGDTSGAGSRRTVPQSNVVVSSINSKGAANYVSDPASGFSKYYAGGSKSAPTPGKTRLCALRADEIASVEYWLYLEGCDDNCYNSVQNRNITLQFGFAGISKEAR